MFATLKDRATRFAIVVIAFSIAAPVCCGELDGFTEPYREIEIAASETGTLATLDVEEGDEVTEGQRLGGLDDGVLKATLEVAEQGMRSQGRLRSAFAEYKMQRERLEKIGGLRQRDHASQAEYDRVAAEYEVATAQVQTMQEDLKVKKLERDQIKAQLDRRQIMSPINGIVTEIVKDRGEFVASSDPIVMRVVQLDPLQVIFFVPTEQARTVRRGEDVNIELGAHREPATASVVFVSPAADAQSGTVRVKVRLPNPGLKRQSGELCRLILPGTESTNANPQATPQFGP